MNEKPYINQRQDWGRDLLNRLNNLMSANGSLNHWLETPVVGPDGEPLGPQHEGFTGLLLADETEIQSWNGTKWESLFRVPVGTTGDPIASAFVSLQNFQVCLLDPSLEYESFFTTETNNTSNTLVVKKYSKATGELQWQSSITLRIGHNFAQISSSKGRHCFDTDNNNIYIGLLEFPSAGELTSGYLSVVAIRQSDGAFLWRSELKSVFANGLYAIALKCHNGSVFLCQRLSTEIFKLNAVSGAIQAVLNYTSSVPTSSHQDAEIFFDPVNAKIVLWVRGSALSSDNSMRVYSIPYDLTSSLLVKDFNVTGADQGLAATNNIFSIDSSPHLFYFVQEENLWLYNYLTNTTEIIATYPSSWILGVRLEGDVFSLLSMQGNVVARTQLSKALGIINQEILTPFGVGSISVPRQEGMSQLSGNQFFLRSTDSSSGLLAVRKNNLEIYTSKGGQRIASFLNSIVTNSTDVNLLRANVNYDELYAGNISSGKISSGRYIAHTSTPATSSVVPTLPDCGLDVGGNIAVFALNGTNSFSPESKGYTGSGGGGFIGGIGWGCQPLQGRIVQHRSSSLFAGISLFDQFLGKFFVQVAPVLPIDSTIPNFPNGSGLVLDASNNLGVGTQSPAFKVQVIGTLSATELRNSGGVVTSDPRMKLNMASLNGEDSWEIMNLLEAISFVYKPDFTVTIEEVTEDEDGNEVVSTIVQHWPLPQGIQIGYNAEQVGQTLPELVQLEPKSKIKYLNSGAIAPIVHQGTVWKINQLQQIVEQQQALIESLTARVEALENAA